jgi:hypothetical protein
MAPCTSPGFACIVAIVAPCYRVLSRFPRNFLSLIDAGGASRAAGKKEFSDVRDPGIAIPRVSEQIIKFCKRAALRNTLRLDYDTVAFDTDVAIDRIEHSLGIVSNRDQVKQHAFAGMTLRI